MNCKPGDLAIIIRETKDIANSGPMAGRLVEVLYAAPATSFYLPDGRPHTPVTQPGVWLVRSLGSPWRAPFSGGTFKASMYGAIPDRVLRPLPGDLEDEYVAETTECPLT